MTLELSHTTVNASNAYAQSVWWADLLGYREDPDDPNLAGHAECMIFSADGSFGSPGIVMMSPHLATTKPAPDGWYWLTPRETSSASCAALPSAALRATTDTGAGGRRRQEG